MRKILLGGRMKEIRKQQKHWMMPDNSSAGREPATTESATSDSETPRGGSPVSFVTRGGFQSPRAASPQLRALSPLAEARSPQFDDRPKPHHNKSTHRGHRQKSAEQQSKSPPPTDGAPQQQPTAGGGDGGPETSSMFPSGAPQEQDFPNPRGGDYVGWIEPMEMGGGDNKGFPGAGQRQVERPSSPSCSESERTSFSSSEWQSDGTVLADRSQHGGSSAAWDST